MTEGEETLVARRCGEIFAGATLVASGIPLRRVHTPLNPGLPCDEQTGAVQLEPLDGRTSDRCLAEEHEPVLAPSEVRAPPSSARVEERDHIAGFGVKGFGPVT